MIPALLVLLAGTATAADTEAVRDIVYARYGEQSLRLDLYLPKPKPAGEIPGIVVIRGGGWRIGDKNGFSKIAQHLASEGFAAACIEYRVLPDNRFPTFVHDSKAAVRWMRAEAVKYGINSNAIGAIGGSAGGHLVAVLGTSHKDAKLEGSGGNTGVSSRVQAVVAMAPVVDLSRMGGGGRGGDEFFDPSLPAGTRVSWASPITHAGKDSAAFLLLHSKADKAVPVAQSEYMLEKLNGLGVPVDMKTLESAEHAFWNVSDFEWTMRHSVDFFRKTLAGR